MSISLVSSAKSVARRLKYQSKLISNLESRAAAQDLVIQSLVTELNSQVRHSQSAVHAAYLLCHSLSSDSGPALQEDCVLSVQSDANRAVDDPDPVPYHAQRVVGDPVPYHAQRAIEACIPDPVLEVAPLSVEEIVERVVTPCPDGQIVDHRGPLPADQVVERVIRAPFVQTPCQVPVPVCVKVPGPRR